MEIKSQRFTAAAASAGTEQIPITETGTLRAVSAGIVSIAGNRGPVHVVVEVGRLGRSLILFEAWLRETNSNVAPSGEIVWHGDLPVTGQGRGDFLPVFWDNRSGADQVIVIEWGVERETDLA